MTDNYTYKLQARKYDIAGGSGGHDFFVIMQTNTTTGESATITELHGFTTDSSSKPQTWSILGGNTIKSYLVGKVPSNLGIPADDKIFYYNNRDNSPFQDPNDTENYRKLPTWVSDNQQYKTIATGTEEEMLNRLSYAIRAGHAVNDLNIAYPWFAGIFNSDSATNSNAMFTTGLYAMGCNDLPNFSGYQPGLGVSLLPASVFNEPGLRYPGAQNGAGQCFLEPYQNSSSLEDGYQVRFVQASADFTIEDALEGMPLLTNHFVSTDLNGTTAQYTGIQGSSLTAAFSNHMGDASSLILSGVNQIASAANGMVYALANSSVGIPKRRWWHLSGNRWQPGWHGK